MKNNNAKKLSDAPKTVKVAAHINAGKSVPAYTRLSKEELAERRKNATSLFDEMYTNKGPMKPVEDNFTSQGGFSLAENDPTFRPLTPEYDPSGKLPLAKLEEPKSNFEKEMDKTESSVEKLDYLLGDVVVEVQRYNGKFPVKISGRVLADIKNNEWDKYLTPEYLSQDKAPCMAMFNYAETAEQFGKIIKACLGMNLPINRPFYDFGYEVGGELRHRIKDGKIQYLDLVKTNMHTIALLKKCGSSLDQNQIAIMGNLIESKELQRELEDKPNDMETQKKAANWLVRSFLILKKIDKE